jgi:chitodextrinase/regulation of enolase protein 1 (concanavalin A-like superfamily)
MVKRLLSYVAISLLMLTSLFPSFASAVTLNTHTVVLDGSGKIVPWTANPADGYDTVMNLAWNYFLHSVPTDSGTGKPGYFSTSYMDPDTQQLVGWPHNPAGLYSMMTESALKYYEYSGNTAVVNKAVELANWHLDHGMTPGTYSWASVPYSSGDTGSLTYDGADYGNTTGVGDGNGYLEPDKIGELGYAWLQLYKYNGDVRFRDAAIQAGSVLAAKVRSGSVNQSPWPFRVNAQTGVVREDYGADVIGPIQLLDGLITNGLGDTSSYQTARTTAWNWMMTYPMQNNNWAQYFEDVSVQSTYNTNLNQYDPMMVARYLLEHPQYDANWEAHVRGIITWVENNFAVASNGANTIKEQFGFPHPMGSHTARYASVNALLYQKTGDLAAKEKAYRAFNWATYMARSNGVVIDGPEVNNQWFSDGYGDYIRHFMTGLGAVPEWAPSGQDHLTGSTSVVKSVNYTSGNVVYTTADNSSTDSLKTSFTPGTVTVNGVSLAQRGDLNQEGWTFDQSSSTLHIRHDNGSNVQIVSGTPGNFPPTVSLTSPASGASYTEPASITLSADASDTDGTVAKVDFYNGSTLLGTSTSAPYSFNWTSVPAGSYSLTAKATDNLGAVTASNAASVTVNSTTSLPAPWQDADIGSTGLAGSASFSNGTYTVKGSGADIWNTADAFNYLYQPLNGDGEISARVNSVQNTNAWAMAGVMMRESLAANSSHADVSMTYGNGWSLTSRASTAGSSTYTNGGTGSAPNWVRLKRAGSIFTSYKSTDGTNWTQFAQSTITMGQNIYVGLAVSAVNNSALNTSTFTNVNVGVPADTVPPTISGIASGAPNQNGTTITWNTNEPADSQVEYGKTTSYGSSTSINGSLDTAHSQVVSGLDAATTYHYRVKSRDAAGNLATSGDNTFFTPAPPDTTPPSAPAGLSAVPGANPQVDLTWTASTDNTGVTGYRVFRNGVQIGTTAGTSYSDATAVKNTTYSYTVKAVDAAGNISADSNTATITTPSWADVTPPSTPQNLTAALNGANTTANLSWSASTDNVGVTGYQVWRNGTQITTVAGTSYSDSSLASGTTYTYTVKAVDAAGNVSAASNSASVTTPTPDTQAPTAPSSVLPTATSSSSVLVSWVASSDNVGVTGYQIFRNGVQVGTSATTSYSDTGLSANTTYTYTVKAVDAAGNISPASAPASVTTPAVAALSTDVNVVTKQSTKASTIASPSFSTAQTNELVVAFIISDGPTSGQSISAVNGGGLTWTLRKRVNTQAGTAEIWQAVAAAKLTNATVTATRATGTYQGMINVVSFIGASLSVNGATGGSSAGTGAPTASLVTTKAGSWVWGAGDDWDSATARTVGANQTKVNEYLSSLGDTFWVQRQTSTTAQTGTTVTLNDTAPTADRWNLALIEIIPQ